METDAASGLAECMIASNGTDDVVTMSATLTGLWLKLQNRAVQSVDLMQGV